MCASIFSDTMLLFFKRIIQIGLGEMCPICPYWVSDRTPVLAKLLDWIRKNWKTVYNLRAAKNPNQNAAWAAVIPRRESQVDPARLQAGR